MSLRILAYPPADAHAIKFVGIGHVANHAALRKVNKYVGAVSESGELFLAHDLLNDPSLFVLDHAHR